MIKVFVVFKTNIFIETVQPLLQGIEVMAVCNNTAVALEKYKSLKPDVIIMDANWTSYSYAVSGPSLIKSILSYDASAKIIIATNDFDADIVKYFFGLGICGYFFRNAKKPVEMIVTCIQEVYNGNTWFANEMNKK